MFDAIEAVLQYAIAVLAAFVCAFQLAGFQFWLLEPGNDGTIGMGLLILGAMIICSTVFIPLALMWTGMRRKEASSRFSLWKQSGAQIVSVAASFGCMSMALRSAHVSVRVAGCLFACGLIVFELLPRRNRLWDAF